MNKLILTACCFALMLTCAHAATLNKVVAVVNGQMISQFDLDQAANAELKKAKIDPKKAENQGQVHDIYAKVLETLILDVLVMGEATRHQITASPEEVDGEIVRLMQRSGLNKKDFEKRMKLDGMTIEALRATLTKNIVRQKLMGMMVGRKVVLTPEEVKTYYDTHQDEMVQNNEAVLALIIYPDKVDAMPYARQLMQDPKQFPQIAKKISEGPNKERGGLLGEVPMEKLDPRLVKIIQELDEGEVTPILVIGGKKSQFQLVKKAAHGELMSFEQAKPYIENLLRQPLLKERFEEYVEQLRSRAVIDVRM